VSDVETVPALLERLKVGDEAPGETLTRVLHDAVALKVLEEAALERCGNNLGYSIELCVSGNGEVWSTWLEDNDMVQTRCGNPAVSLGLALRSAAEAVGKGEA
jgi:hypothetical protein